MKLQGVEEARFAAGMFDAAARDFWSYVIVFRLDGGVLYNQGTSNPPDRNPSLGRRQQSHVGLYERIAEQDRRPGLDNDARDSEQRLFSLSMMEARLDRPVAFQVLPTSPPNLI